MQLTLPVVTTAALLDSINPCAISVLFLTLGFLASMNASRKKILTVTGLYIFGIFLVYVLIGLGILSVLSFFGIPKAISKIGAILLIITSLLNLAETYIPNFPIKLAIPSFIKPQIASLMYKATSISAFFMGVVVGLFEFPCTGGPYLMILSLLHDSSTISLGAFYLIYYNLIFISPLVAIMLLGSSQIVTNKIQSWRKKNSKNTSAITALATLVLGVIILLI
jgi:cytochrome c biogenesis protein CcdA